MTSFAIIRTKKHKSLAAIRNISKHHTREITCKTADPAKTPRNLFYGAGSTGANVAKKVREVISDAEKKHGKKFRSDSVKAIEYLMTASPEFWKKATKQEKSGYLKKCLSWLEKKHGAGCVVASWIHFDERSPHIHAVVVPLLNGVLNAKAYLGGRETCSELQTDFYTQCGVPFGLSRGVIKSEAKHMKVADFWASMDAPEPKPTKGDFAKAALGMEVPSINDALTQSQALKAFEAAQNNLKTRMKRIDLRERELAVQESFLGDKLKLSQRVSELERENETLKMKVRKLETPSPGTYVPGHAPGKGLFEL
jgi:hypothetical protein